MKASLLKKIADEKIQILKDRFDRMIDITIMPKVYEKIEENAKSGKYIIYKRTLEDYFQDWNIVYNDYCEDIIMKKLKDNGFMINKHDVSWEFPKQ